MRRIIRTAAYQLHLYLGLISGIVMFVVCITGSLYVFKDEVNDLLQPWKFVGPQEKEMLLPETLLEIANTEVGIDTPWAITYGEPFDAVWVDYFLPGGGSCHVYLNPYSGEVIRTIRKEAGQFDFFRFVLTGHRTLWLPRQIGKQIIGYSVLLFIITLITGLVLWWPRKWTKAAVKRDFTIRKTTSFTFLNFKLHNVLGGYAALVLLLLSFTGLIWSFQWFSEGVYKLTSGGKELLPYTLPNSDPEAIPIALEKPLDQLYLQLKEEMPGIKTFYFALPQKENAVIRVSAVHKRGSYYRTDNLFFDPYTLQPLPGTGPYAGKYQEASAADKLRRMNLEIHDGRMWGLLGKMIMFLASLTGASLPVTGVILWYKRIRRNRSRRLS
ncbi:MAG: PepSY domain-containing protein [Tannerellaceae bacterium]|nr:PepSY domain-containing protein [Tannerellaceae bacterium]